MPVLVFQSSHRTIKAERTLRSSGIEVEVIPTPKEINTECGMSLYIHIDLLEEALSLLASHGIDVEDVYSEGLKGADLS